MGYWSVQEDTAGNKYYAEFDERSTGSIRNWATDKDGKILWEIGRPVDQEPHMEKEG